eukprot:scaffold3210_cov402-Prasinococcus_capsulatus_cf.AAC.11
MNFFYDTITDEEHVEREASNHQALFVRVSRLLILTVKAPTGSLRPTHIIILSINENGSELASVFQIVLPLGAYCATAVPPDAVVEGLPGLRDIIETTSTSLTMRQDSSVIDGRKPRKGHGGSRGCLWQMLAHRLLRRYSRRTAELGHGALSHLLHAQMQALVGERLLELCVPGQDRQTRRFTPCLIDNVLYRWKTSTPSCVPRCVCTRSAVARPTLGAAATSTCAPGARAARLPPPPPPPRRGRRRRHRQLCALRRSVVGAGHLLPARPASCPSPLRYSRARTAPASPGP